MKYTLTTSEAADMLRDKGFTWVAAVLIVEYMEELEESCNEPIEFDAAVLCGEWSEYEDLKEIVESYHCLCGIASFEELIEALEEETVVLHDGDFPIVIQDF